MKVTVEVYQDVFGNQPYVDWLDDLRDGRAKQRIRARVNRLRDGSFGDCKPVGGSVLELRIDYGPGYRVYLARRGPVVVLLLVGGDKRSQSADIDRAMRCLADYERRAVSG